MITATLLAPCECCGEQHLSHDEREAFIEHLFAIEPPRDLEDEMSSSWYWLDEPVWMP